MGLNGEIIDLNDIVHCNHLGFALWAQSEYEMQQLKLLV